MTSTGGAAFCLLVSGPVTAELQMATRHNALGPGNRANAAVGRTLRLVARNVFGARSGEMDASSIGHPGKFTLCLAEDGPPAPWEPLRVELGHDFEDSTVTILGTEGPRQVANHLNPSPEGILTTMAAAMSCPATYPVGKGHQAVVVLGPEHTAALIEAGWTRRAGPGVPHRRQPGHAGRDRSGRRVPGGRHAARHDAGTRRPAPDGAQRR